MTVGTPSDESIFRETRLMFSYFKGLSLEKLFFVYSTVSQTAKQVYLHSDAVKGCLV